MSNLINGNLENELNVEEKNLLKCVTENYDFNVLNFIKVRSAYRVETDKGIMCIKKINHGNHKVDNGNLLVQGLKIIIFPILPNIFVLKMVIYL